MNSITNKTTKNNSPAGEVGAAENRLILDPSDSRWSESVGNWEDGKEYKGEITIQQVAPGQFEVTSFEAASESDESETPAESGAGDKAEAETGSTGGSSYENPAVAGMMNG